MRIIGINHNIETSYSPYCAGPRLQSLDDSIGGEGEERGRKGEGKGKGGEGVVQAL